MKTALQAMRLGVVIYFVPFFFVFNPSLILRGQGLETFYLFAFCLLGILLIAVGLEGYLIGFGRVSLFARPWLILAGILAGFPEWRTTAIGAALASVVVLALRLREKFSYPPAS